MAKRLLTISRELKELDAAFTGFFERSRGEVQLFHFVFLSEWGG